MSRSKLLNLHLYRTSRHPGDDWGQSIQGPQHLFIYMATVYYQTKHRSR